MRIPKTPPDFSDLIKKASADQKKLLELMHTVSSGTSGQYRHWDDPFYRKPPEGLTHEEWWLGLKMSRMAAANILPLMLDKKGSAFSYNLAEPIPERLHEIDLRAGGRIEMPSQVANPETRDRYYIESQIEEAITSSQLEGASTTRRVAKQLIRSGRQPRGRSETMIFNNYLTMKKIVKLKTEEITPELVLHIHEHVTRILLMTLPPPAGSEIPQKISTSRTVRAW